MNIDGINKKTRSRKKQKSTPKPQTQTVRRRRSTKPIDLFVFFNTRQLTTVIVTFLFTFILSIATSQSFASFSSKFSKPDETIPATLTNAPDVAVTTQPDLFHLNQEVLDHPDEVFLPKEKLSLPDPLKKRKEFLESYLKSKNSPLADHVEAISEQSQWKLIIAISRAESSFCKHQVTNNCWGIGGAWNMKNYKNFDEAVADVNRILEEHYIQAGLNTPNKIVGKYVGHRNDNWQAAVEQELQTLSKIE